MNPNTYQARSFAQDQAFYLEDFQNNPQQAYDNHAKHAAQLRLREDEEAASRSGFFQNNEALRALNGKNDTVAEIDRRAKERVPNMEQIYPTYVNGGANMGYSQNYRSHREQWVYGGQSEDVEAMVNDQPSGIARSQIRDPTASNARNDHSMSGLRLDASLEATNNDVPIMNVQSRFNDWGSAPTTPSSHRDSVISYAQNDRGSLGLLLSTNLEITDNNRPSLTLTSSTYLPPQPTPSFYTSRAHIRDSIFSYAQRDHGSLQQRLRTDLTLAQDIPQDILGVFGERDDWSGRDSKVYDQSKEEQFDSFVMSRKRGQYYKNRTGMVKAMIEEIKNWAKRGLR